MSGILIGIIDILGHSLLVKQDNRLRKEHAMINQLIIYNPHF